MLSLKAIQEIARITFKNDDDEPMELSLGQAEIFRQIYLKVNPRVEILAPTQYGKSNTVAMAVLLRSQQFKEDFTILAGEQKKSDVIMGKIIDHIFDNPILLDNLELDKTEPLDRIRRERTKKKITWKDGGSIQTVTADAKNRKNVTRSLSGLGSPNIIEDEASLIPDDLQAMVLRMLGGYNGGFLMKIGNPYNRGHFWKTWNSDKYFKVFIDYKQALAEKRYTEDFINEMRGEMFFDVLYECEFPKENAIDIEGYNRLLDDDEIKNAKGEAKHEGTLRLGIDVGEGGDENVAILRSSKYAQIVHISRIKDLMATTRVILDLMKEHKVSDENTFIDATGIGAGIVSRLKELNKNVTGIKWAEKPRKDIYANLKAENYMEMREGIKNGLKLQPNDNWNELELIKWKKNTSDKIIMKSKEQMRKEGIKSPNIADALALTFNRSIEQDAPRIWNI